MEYFEFKIKLKNILEQIQTDSIFVLTDENTHQFCLPLLQKDLQNIDYKEIIIDAGERSKNLETAVKIWQFLIDNQATRKSLFINLGGGVVSDIGGFAAATFMRGMPFVNVPTTLLAAVDAAFGGKTGINFANLKNEIGVFAQPEHTLLNVDFFKTLDTKNLLSGFAEMLKHSLISSYEFLYETLNFDLQKFDLKELEPLLQKNILFKQNIINQDFKEAGLRKTLNFGHTFGHAFEAFFAETNSVLHGYAVAWGMLCELYLSFIKLNFSKNILLKINSLIKNYYGKPNFSCKHYDTLYNIMLHDKKNSVQTINFVLLTEVGQPQIDQQATKKEIWECLDFFREN
ncbi:MAG: 3-dehydroquinate synthase [Paludibacter sp.]|nr:3-dehydroquinate synthase [Paludibacter sp.]